MRKGFAFITDKRVYFKGSCLNGTGKALIKTNEERTVDMKNIIGSGFTYHRYWGIIIASILPCLIFVGAFPAVIYYVVYDLRAKDLAEESATKTPVIESPVQLAAQNSVPDDLRKYADLLKEGLISQEEYDAMKKEDSRAVGENYINKLHQILMKLR